MFKVVANGANFYSKKPFTFLHTNVCADTGASGVKSLTQGHKSMHTRELGFKPLTSCIQFKGVFRGDVVCLSFLRREF